MTARFFCVLILTMPDKPNFLTIGDVAYSLSNMGQILIALSKRVASTPPGEPLEWQCGERELIQRVVEELSLALDFPSRHFDYTSPSSVVKSLSESSDEVH